MKVKVCKSCGSISDSLRGQKDGTYIKWSQTCREELGCDGSQIEVEEDLDARCICGKVGHNIAGIYTSLPFYNHFNKTFYCGHAGF